MNSVKSALKVPAKLILAGALAWMLTAEFLAVQLVAAFGAPGFDWRFDDISLLGVTSCGLFRDPLSGKMLPACSHLHAVMNGGFVACGALVLLGAILTFWAWPRSIATRVGLVLVAVSSVGTVLSGAAPENVDPRLHTLGAVLYFFTVSAALFCLAGGLRRTRPVLALAALVCGLLTVGGFLAFGNYQQVGLPRGVLERIAGYPSILWFIGAGRLLFLEIRQRADAGA